MEIVFWISLLLIAYPYVLYPAILVALNRARVRGALHAVEANEMPSVSVILPIHNEQARIRSKVANLLELDYPADKLQLIVVGDGCTDESLDRAAATGGTHVRLLELPHRGGKAPALNAGLDVAVGDIVVFTDAGILLEPMSLRRLVARFGDPSIGCVSGEDYIEGQASEGLYGRFELKLRNEEASLHSIAGASGCFYAQRRSLCEPFVPGMAPDFLSVLSTVRAGKRAITESTAKGRMTATSSQGAEFARKTRTLLRGMTALFANVDLLNPLRYPAFSFILLSHKLMRWLAPVPLVGALVSAWALREQPLYMVMLVGQLALYGLAAIGLLLPWLADRLGPVRLCAFFLMVNAAAAKALLLWMSGIRVEVWQPTHRPG